MFDCFCFGNSDITVQYSWQDVNMICAVDGGNDLQVIALTNTLCLLVIVLSLNNSSSSCICKPTSIVDVQLMEFKTTRHIYSSGKKPVCIKQSIPDCQAQIQTRMELHFHDRLLICYCCLYCSLQQLKTNTSFWYKWKSFSGSHLWVLVVGVGGVQQKGTTR